MNYSSVIIKPLITEKSINRSQFGKYTFLINPLATKEDVKLAMKKVLGVNVTSVNIVRYRDHKRRVNYVDPSKGARHKKTVHIKKAVVQLGPDEKLDYFNVE